MKFFIFMIMLTRCGIFDSNTGTDSTVVTMCKESYDGELEKTAQFTCKEKEKREVCCPHLERWKRCCAEQNHIVWRERCQDGLYRESYQSFPCFSETNSDETNIEVVKKKRLYFDCCTDFGPNKEDTPP